MGVLARRLECYVKTGGRPVDPNQATRTVASVLRVQACNDPCSSLLNRLVRAEASVSCKGRGRSAVQDLYGP
jgi:hypothetical protein